MTPEIRTELDGILRRLDRLEGKPVVVPVVTPSVPPVATKTIGELITNIDMQIDIYATKFIDFTPSHGYGMLPFNIWQVIQLIAEKIPVWLPHRRGKEWEILQACPNQGDHWADSPSHVPYARVVDVNYLTLDPGDDDPGKLWNDGVLNTEVFDLKGNAELIKKLRYVFPRSMFGVSTEIRDALLPYLDRSLWSAVSATPAEYARHDRHMHIDFGREINLGAVV